MIGYNLMGEPISGSQELSFKFGWGKKKKKSAWLNLALPKIYIIYDSKKMIRESLACNQILPWRKATAEQLEISSIPYCEIQIKYFGL